MKPSRIILEVSYDLCRQLSKRSGSNFYLSFLLLPKDKRRAMDAIYAFMRHTDDLVDAKSTFFLEAFPKTIEARREVLSRWRKLFEAALSGNYLYADSAPSRGNICINSETTFIPEYLLLALVDTIEKFSLPVQCFYDVLDGVEMDLDRHCYENFDELALYCRRVASAVGLACIHIWGFRGQGTPEGERVIEIARQAGIALQLTNILRDLKADAAADRIYLPLEDLRNCGYSVEELKNGVVNEAFYRLLDMEINRARQLYREGCKLFDLLDRDGQKIFGLMITVYRSLLEKIALQPDQVFSRTVKLGKFERLVLFLYWTLIPSIMAEKYSRSDNR